MNHAKIIAQNIRRARQARTWSLRALAARAGLAHSTVWALEKAKTDRIEFHTLRQIALALGCEVDTLIRADDQEEKP
jgi:transcriptional regulator with XRE-family HTH domain